MRLNIQLFIFFVLIILSSCGDDKKDEPNNPVEPVTRTWINIERENPFRETPLMAPYERSFGRKMWTTRVVEDSGLKGKGGDYYYWEQHKAEAGTMAELLALCDVPEDKLYAMSTRNLALTCFMHPYNGVYDMYNVLYESVFTMTLANCYQELMQRLTGATELLNLYCELDYPKSKPVNTTAGLSYEDYNKNTFENILHLNGLTLFLMTAVDFNALNKEQLSVLSSEIFKKIDNIATADEGVYDYYTMRFPYLLGAFIAYHYDEQLNDEEATLLYNYTGFSGLPGVAGELSFTSEDVSRSTLIIIQSLERMK